MEKSFTISPRVIAHLGEDLIKNESIALLELVKNSYDAYASVCKVDFHYRGNQLSRITISDDGVGMDKETIETVWLTIGTDNKKKQLEIGEGERIPLGEKGIGRLGVHKLGRKITMFTHAKGNPLVEVNIEWDKLETSKSISDFKANIEEKISLFDDVELQHGTKIIISNLKGTWDRRKIRQVYRDLTSLNSPFGSKNDTFRVEITTNSNVFEGLPSVEEILQVAMYRVSCTIERDRIIDFHYLFRPWPQLDRIQGRTVNSLDNDDCQLLHRVEYVDERGKTKYTTEPFSISDYKIGKIRLEMAIFEKDASVFSLMNMERTALNSYLKENGGVRVYRDDVRVYNYGEKDNDWLSIDYRRIQRAGGNINNSSVLGAVSLNRRNSTDLKEKTNREGFIENDAYYAFVDAVAYAVDIITKYRNIDKERLISVYKEDKRVIEPVVSELNSAMQLVEAKVQVREDREAILNCLTRVNEQYQDVRDVLLRSANAGLNLGVVIHEIDKQVMALQGYAERGMLNEVKDISKRLEKTLGGYTVLLSNSSIKETPVSSIVGTVIETNRFRFADHNIKLFSNRKNTNFYAYLSKAEAVAALTNLIDNSIYWVSKSRMEDRMIYIYITDQRSGYITIAVLDNGPGFKLPPEMAIRPFVTGKPLNTGMGLGLHVTHEVMLAMKGELVIYDKNEFDLPLKAKDLHIDSSIVALCFPIAYHE
jgi:signal transduction histidine kinase